MLNHETTIRVRYGETDQMGYLYYGAYALYYEVGRAEAIRSIGLTYKDMELTYGIFMPVMSFQIRFVRPAFYDEELTVKTQMRHLPTRTMTFYHEIFNEQHKLLNGGSVRLGFVEAASRRSVDAPGYLLEKLKPFFAHV